MQRLLTLACALALTVGLGGCRDPGGPHDYSSLTRMAERLPGLVGTPPGVAAVDAVGGAAGDGGYFQITVTLDAGATPDELLGLLDEELPAAMERAGGSAGASLVVRSAGVDALTPGWGEYADLDAEEAGIRAWFALAAAVEGPVTADVDGDLSSFTVGFRRTSTSAPGTGTDDGRATAPSSNGDEALVAHVRRLLGGVRQAGPFRPRQLAVQARGQDVITCDYSFLVPARIADGELTVATYGDVLLPVLAEQAAACAPGSFRATVSRRHRVSTMSLLEARPLVPGDESRAAAWARALHAAARRAGHRPASTS